MTISFSEGSLINEKYALQPNNNKWQKISTHCKHVICFYIVKINIKNTVSGNENVTCSMFLFSLLSIRKLSKAQTVPEGCKRPAPRLRAHCKQQEGGGDAHPQTADSTLPRPHYIHPVYLQVIKKKKKNVNLTKIGPQTSFYKWRKKWKGSFQWKQTIFD